MVALCWPYTVTTRTEEHWMYCAALMLSEHMRPPPPLIYLCREVTTFGALQDRDLAGGVLRCSTHSPDSDVVRSRRRFQAELGSSRPRAAVLLFCCFSTLFEANGHFGSWIFPCLQSRLLPPASKRCGGGGGHQWSLWTLLHNNLLKDGISTSDSRRHSPAPLSELVRARGPGAKLIVHKLIQPPWFCLFKWDS